MGKRVLLLRYRTYVLVYVIVKAYLELYGASQKEKRRRKNRRGSRAIRRREYGKVLETDWREEWSLRKIGKRENTGEESKDSEHKRRRRWIVETMLFFFRFFCRRDYLVVVHAVLAVISSFSLN